MNIKKALKQLQKTGTGDNNYPNGASQAQTLLLNLPKTSPLYLSFAFPPTAALRQQSQNNIDTD